MTDLVDGLDLWEDLLGSDLRDLLGSDLCEDLGDLDFSEGSDLWDDLLGSDLGDSDLGDLGDSDFLDGLDLWEDSLGSVLGDSDLGDLLGSDFREDLLDSGLGVFLEGTCEDLAEYDGTTTGVSSDGIVGKELSLDGGTVDSDFLEGSDFLDSLLGDFL